MKLHLVASGSRLALAVCALGFACGTASAQDAAVAGGAASQTAVSDNLPENAIVVSGVRQSIEGAINDKRQSSEIKDSITAEDIGQLANDNIAEALQRITGVQVDRSNDGEGKQVQIRGLSENNVTINGATVTGTGDVDLSNENDRGVNFQDLPAELFSGVEILKALTADQIEGSLGGSINLQTRAPLKGRRDFILNLSGTETYRQLGRLYSPAGNLFVQKQFKDTPLGDFGVILDFGYKEINTNSEVYGAGEYAGAPGEWTRLSGANATPTSTGTNQSAANYNFFALANIPNSTTGTKPNPYQYVPVDVNGDGIANASDTVYVPGAFGVSHRTRNDTRRTFNGTLQWKPASNLDIRFDTVLTGLDQNMTGANLNIVSNVPRAGILTGGAGSTFQLLEDTPSLGPVYVMTGGRLASFTTRVGAQPSINETRRKSQQYSLEATWDVAPNFSLFAEGTTSRGSATTLNFGQLNTGIEDQGGNTARFNNQDFYSMVDFNLASGLIPNVILYEDPFPAPNWGVTSVVPEANLVALNPGDLSYKRYRYFQYQRNAADTANKDDSIRFDATLDTGDGFLKTVKFGYRWADRGFKRARYQNQNQGGGVYSQWDGTRAPVQAVLIQQIPLNPAYTTDPVAAATSNFLSSCLTTATIGSTLSQFGGNLPTTFGSTAGCDITKIQDYFNMIDIRAINPATGAGYYEVIPERYSDTEDTSAGYLRADFMTNLGQVPMYGNIGLRYVWTETSSNGYELQADKTYKSVTFRNHYGDFLPSANVNFGLSRKLIARAAYSRTLGRPPLTQISPGLDITRSDSDPNYAGFGVAGNPFLKAIHSDNFDTSLEWYYAKDGYISIAAFAKNIDSTIFLDPTPSDYEINGEVFSVQTYRNFGGTKLRGLEFGMAHGMHYLPGILRHLGVTGNLSVISESSSLRDQEGDPISRRGLSKLTYNLGAYYDDGKLSLRFAYNWRSKFTRTELVQLGYNRPEALPEIEAARGQLDFSARWAMTRNIRFSFNAVNLTNTGTYRYLKYPILVNYLSKGGRAFSMAVAFNF